MSDEITRLSEKIEEVIKLYVEKFSRLITLITEEKRYVFPNYLRYPCKIYINVFNDYIVVDFKRQIKEKNYIFHKRAYTKSITKSEYYPIVRRPSMFKVEHEFSLGKLTAECGHGGLVDISPTGAVKIYEVWFKYINKKGKPKSLKINCLWILGHNFIADTNIHKKINNWVIDDFKAHISELWFSERDKESKLVPLKLDEEISKIKSELEMRISSENVEEAEIQMFLEKHPFILHPDFIDFSTLSVDIRPQVNINKSDRPDFLVISGLELHSEAISIFVCDLKKPTDKLFTRGGYLSSKLIKAIEQVQKYTNKLKTLLKNVTNVDVRGIVIIGRKLDLTEKHRKILEELSKNSGVNVITYDELLDNVTKLQDFFRTRKPNYRVIVVGQKGTEDEDFTGNSGDVIQMAINELSRSD